ncbi:unnamed protein product [Arctia plantaginis]|uniref:Uncharacterized protein n=1 Tax=Arctia plantaginis TaxID=874455 RepID=A0A8S0YTC6_ARCPL|nr:unnamed protein product [Arctia plantaginis]
MAIKLAPIILCLLHWSAVLSSPLSLSEPANTLEAIEDVSDSESVGSYIRETRAAYDGDYYKSNENEGNGEIGYSRKKSGGGKKGYQHFDSFHKKAGDNYEFEKQDSFGLDDKGQDGAYSHRNERRANRDDGRKREREPEEFEDEHEEIEDSHRQKAKQRKGKDHAELREESPNENGRVESSGHDPKDYTLPERYTYGDPATEYDF